MDIEIQAVLGQNITLVYDTLDLQTIDSGELKELMGVQIKPTVMDTPEMIVGVYPPQPIVVEIGDRRIRITLQLAAEDIGGVPLWEIALKCDQLVPKPKSKFVAYGFNYDVGIASTSGNAQEVILGLFVPNREMIEAALEGHLLSIIPRLIFQRDQTRYDLALESVDEQHVKVHMNTHFGFEGVTLPSRDDLQASFQEEYRYLVSMLPRLFHGGG